MNPITIPLLSTLFTTFATVIGIPSISFLVFYGLFQVTKLTHGARANTSFGSNPDALLLILKWMSTAIGAIGDLVSAAAEFISDVLAVASLSGLALAILCWVTGHGLSANAGWSRVSACIVLVPLMLLSLVLAMSFDSKRLAVPS